MAEQIVPRGECRFCRNNQYWMCQVHNIFGFKRHLNGGMAKYTLPAKSLVHKVPESLTDGQAAYIEPMACAWHAVDRGEIKEATPSSSAASATSASACCRSRSSSSRPA